jgi:selenocysteine lyase/cysteine desulfurase
LLWKPIRVELKERTKASESEDRIIYFDNAATTFPKPESVYQELDRFYRRYGGNAGRGGSPIARVCARLVEETRVDLARWLQAPAPERLIFTSSATHALNLAILGHKFRPGDVVYVTPFEHNSVLRPLEYLRQSKGIIVKQIPFNRHTLECRTGELAAAFQIEPPSMVCIAQASNVFGLMPPVIDIAKLSKQANSSSVVVVDGAQIAGLYPLKLEKGIIDALIFSGHKSLYGPYGVAGLVLGSDWEPETLMYGGTGTFSEKLQMPLTLPSAFEAGSHNVLDIAGLSAAIKWLQSTGRQTIVEQTTRISGQLLGAIAALPDYETISANDRSPWCGVFSFTVRGITPQSVEAILGSKGLTVRAGIHCSPWAHQWLGTDQSGGTVRVSPGFFSSDNDASILLDNLRLIQESI